MVDYFRGAAVRAKQDKRPLTLNEASFAMCAVAVENGIKTPEEFLRHMGRAWIAYQRVTVSESEAKPIS